MSQGTSKLRILIENAQIEIAVMNKCSKGILHVPLKTAVMCIGMVN